MAMEVEYNGEVPELNDEEAQIEQLLSDKLMQGYVLLEKSCPSCATPLVKKGVEDTDDPRHNAIKAMDNPVLVSSQSFEQPFRPIAGVPFCVACQSHVVTEEAEISILERCDSLKHKGSILVALKGDSFTDASQSHYDTVPEQEQDEQGEEAQEKSMPNKQYPPASPSFSLRSLEENSPSMMDQDEEYSPASPQHDEKKEEEPSAAVTPSAATASFSQDTGMVTDQDHDADDIMAEYSVR
jgi:hypothetical protein